jgi:hypothetical protein
MALGDKIKWENADFKWDLAPTDSTADRYTWSVVQELVAVAISGGLVQPAVEALDPEKKKKLIRLIMKRKGITIYNESKEVKNINVHINEIKTIIEESSVKLQVENIQV